MAEFGQPLPDDTRPETVDTSRTPGTGIFARAHAAGATVSLEAVRLAAAVQRANRFAGTAEASD